MSEKTCPNEESITIGIGPTGVNETKLSAPGQLVQLGEDLIQGRRVENSQAMKTVALVEDTHLKHEGNRGKGQAIPSVGLKRAWSLGSAWHFAS